MSVKEGMRRLALLIGILGAAIGCFASYVVSRDALEAHSRYQAFERLETSDVVQQERKALQEQHESFFRPWRGPWDEYREAPKDAATTWKSFSPERREELLAGMTPEQKHKLRTVIEQQTLDRDFYAVTRGFKDDCAVLRHPSSELRLGLIQLPGAPSVRRWRNILPLLQSTAQESIHLFLLSCHLHYKQIVGLVYRVNSSAGPASSATCNPLQRLFRFA